MTYIEFFSKDCIENVCSALTHIPDRIILVGDRRREMSLHADRYREILALRGYAVDISCRSVDRNNMSKIIDLLTEIVCEYGDCVFDLTGGEDAFLVAAGIVYERHRDRNIKMHWFNINSNSVKDSDLDGETIRDYPHPKISVEENIKIYGGDIVYTDSKLDSTYKWSIDADFERDINTMWNICRKNTQDWNAQIGVFAAAAERDKSGTLSLRVPADDMRAALSSKYKHYACVINELIRFDLISGYSYEGDCFTVSFKNEQIMRCLTKAGQALEMKVFLAARKCSCKDGPVYDDVMNGVCIDWDGNINFDRTAADTENEIDILMMRGMIPVFISCKNGYVNVDELYKLNTVATRFGGRYARRVLVASALPDSGRYVSSIKCRAADMGIRIIDNITQMNDAELYDAIGSLWRN